MTTAKDYLESALEALSHARMNIDRRETNVARGYLCDVRLEILAAARVLGIELEKESEK